ncbi:hypothetical protein CKO35_10215 [Ectothiorhodospira shaposhnikovii]|uniref:YgaP family membrane protein n=1 Tax=Ectothiorhodospira shaposhnikovii TaxID=1054 RepID=UPI0019037BBA|nr:DUF2892 domain-containing protein [Ectothiorhodospira shaposhnikovii]MBK1673675.1 hypothetical protein [Ectothiorhodospira shaposhnikovii]
MNLEELKNMGPNDRLIRLVVGLGLIAIVFVGPQTPWGWLGLIPLASALMSWCPVYTLFNIRTDDKESS